MKLTKKFRAVLLGAGAAVIISTAAVAAYAYDGSTDPLITLSFLNKFKQEEVDPQILDLKNQIAALQSQIEQLQTSSSGNTSAEAPIVATEAGYEIVQVMKGTKVLAGSSCDIMLRSGTAVAVSPFETQGLSDYTAGVEVMNNEAVTINHMMLIPRGDGRGIRITSEEAYIMIRGAYSLES